MAHLTKMLSNVALAEFVFLAVLALWQWRRYPVRGAGWAALSFLLLASIGLTGAGIRLGLIAPDQALLKLLVGALWSCPSVSTGSPPNSTGPAGRSATRP